MQARLHMENTAVLGWNIRRAGDWFVAEPQRQNVHKVFEAPSMEALVHKIQRWSRVVGATETSSLT